MHQVVMNLATNAAHAMEGEGGRLTITLDDIDQRKDGTVIKGLEEQAKVVQLIVGDTGRGMSRSVVDRIFDPYFTTKIKGKGTGMGLAVVHGIVKSYGGEIRVESQLGKGSRFLVYLPAADVRRTEADGARPSDHAAGGSESILLVDDEPQIVNLLQIMLSSMGYRVSAHTDSRSAIRAFEADPQAFQLVLTDMTMPGITGEELARHVLRMRPDLPVLLATGFSESINEDKARRMGIRKLLFKPILREELAAVLRDVLEPANEAGRQKTSAPLNAARNAGRTMD
jgi:CheY-like chemotaxis protein